MKYSTLSFIISSSILLHACGSSNDIQNHTTDPNPNQNSQHQSNSHNINGNQSSNNSNQAANPSHNSNQQNNQNDFTPNISSGNAPKPKNNIIISANNNDGDIETGLIIPLKEVKLDELTKEKLEEWIKNKNERWGAAKAKLATARAAKTNADTAVGDAKTAISGNLKKIAKLEAAIAVGTDVDTNKAELAKVREETEKLNADYQNALTQQIKATVNSSVAEKQKSLAEIQENELIANANNFVEGKDIDPELVLKYFQAHQAHFQAKADELVARENKGIVTTKVKDIEKAIQSLESINEDAKKIRDGKGYSNESKEVAKDVIAKNNAEIKKLEKEAQKAKEVAQSEAQKEALAIYNRDNYIYGDYSSLKSRVKYRGVYGDGAYPGDFKTVKEVTFKNGKWILELKDVEKPLEIDTGNPIGNGYESFSRKTHGFYKKGSNGKYSAFSVLKHQNPKEPAALQHSIYGYTEDDKFFSVGQVAPENSTVAVGTFKGNAYLTTKDNATGKDVSLVSAVDVTINNGGKSLTGGLSDFVSYEKGNSDINMKKKYKDSDSAFTNTIYFSSDIKGNKFIPKKVEGQAEAYGYFYGDDNGNITEMGGLLKHNKFEGAFGAVKK